MAAGNATHQRWSEVELETLNPLLDRQFVVGEDIMLARVLLKKGCIVPMHSHANEQITYILEGALHFEVGGNRSRCAPERCSAFRPMYPIARKRSKTRSISMSSVLPAPTGSTSRTLICANSARGSPAGYRSGRALIQSWGSGVRQPAREGCSGYRNCPGPHSRPRRLARPRTPPFHGDNTGSNPVGDANSQPALKRMLLMAGDGAYRRGSR